MFSSIVMDVESDRIRSVDSIDELIKVIETLYEKKIKILKDLGISLILLVR